MLSVFPCGQLTGCCGTVVGLVTGTLPSYPNESFLCKRGVLCGTGTSIDPTPLVGIAE
jgi:hypothetical protein